jgi:uncharacterized protein with PIN domain
MIVLDSSVIVAVFRSEPEGDDLLRRLSRSRERVMSAANWFEAAMVIEGKEEFDQTEEFDALIAALGVAVVPLTPEHAGPHGTRSGVTARAVARKLSSISAIASPMPWRCRSTRRFYSKARISRART